MSLEEKFNAAVNVIRGLPKSGSYQPSNELMLRFYSYFKQATEGPCEKPKPGFWDVVNRAKWESWNKLGNMTREEAMQAYVEELQKIVETMSYNSDVASFLSVGEAAGDLQLVAGDVLARVRSSHNTPSCSQSVSGASSPARAPSPTQLERFERSERFEHSERNRHDSDDEFIDTVDDDLLSSNRIERFIIKKLMSPSPQVFAAPTPSRTASSSPPSPSPPPMPHSDPEPAPRLSNGHAHQITSQLTHLKVLEQLPGTLARLEADVAALRKAVEGDRRILDQVSGGVGRAGAVRPAWRWPWQELSTPTMVFVVLWPFLAFRLLARLQRRTHHT